MDEQQYKARTKGLALDVLRMTEQLPRTRIADIIARQLIRSATSVGANYRASCRARSVEEVVAKLAIVEEEADESVYWLELLVDSHLVDEEAIRPILREANEIVAMTVASKKTLKARIEQRGFVRQPPRIGNRES